MYLASQDWARKVHITNGQQTLPIKMFQEFAQDGWMQWDSGAERWWEAKLTFTLLALACKFYLLFSLIQFPASLIAQVWCLEVKKPVKSRASTFRDRYFCCSDRNHVFASLQFVRQFVSLWALSQQFVRSREYRSLKQWAAKSKLRSSKLRSSRGLRMIQQRKFKRHRMTVQHSDTIWAQLE